MACFVVPMGVAILTTTLRKKFPERLHIDWLNLMLWGGTVMFIVEHIIHKELVLYPPFFTKGGDEIFYEIVQIGVPITLAIFFVWGVLVFVSMRRGDISLAKS